MESLSKFMIEVEPLVKQLESITNDVHSIFIEDEGLHWKFRILGSRFSTNISSFPMACTLAIYNNYYITRELSSLSKIQGEDLFRIIHDITAIFCKYNDGTMIPINTFMVCNNEINYPTEFFKNVMNFTNAYTISNPKRFQKSLVLFKTI